MNPTVLLNATAFAESPVPIGSDRELFIDHYLIDSMDNVSLALATPVHKDVALTFDAPWEGRYCGYITVFQDGDIYRMYYRGLPEAKRTVPTWKLPVMRKAKTALPLKNRN